MRIALCDADPEAIKAAKRIIYEYANLRGIELLVEEYASGAELLISKIKYPLVILITVLKTSTDLKPRGF